MVSICACQFSSSDANNNSNFEREHYCHYQTCQLHTYLSSLSLIKQVPIVYEQDLLDKYKGVRSGGRPFDSKSTLGRCNTHFVLSLFLQAEHHFEF